MSCSGLNTGLQGEDLVPTPPPGETANFPKNQNEKYLWGLQRGKTPSTTMDPLKLSPGVVPGLDP